MLQFFIKRKRFFFFLFLIILCLTLLARGVEKKKHPNPFDRLLLMVFAYPLKLTELLKSQTLETWNNYFFLVNLRQENTALNKRLGALEIENQLLREKATENKRLKALLSFKKKFSYKILPAEIIGRDPSSWFKTIIIDKGASAGVSRGCGVIIPKGVVGRVIEVAHNSAKVLLLHDVNSSVDAVVQRTRARGIVEGHGETTCKLSYVLKSEDLKPGDEIISSGLNGIFPKGVRLGEVSRIDKGKTGFFQVVELLPFVDFSKLSEVLIVLKEVPES